MAQRDQSTESRAFGTFGISAAEQPRMPKASGIVGQEMKTFRRSHYYGSYQAVKRPSGKILSMALAMLALTGPLRAQTLTPVYDFALPVGHAYAIGNWGSGCIFLQKGLDVQFRCWQGEEWQEA